MNNQLATQNILDNPGESSHIVQIYENKESQLAGITRYITSGLLNGEAVIFIATRALREAVISSMNAWNFDIQAAKHAGQIKFFDAELLLSSFMIDDEFDNDAFLKFVGNPIRAARLKYEKVRTLSEMTDFLQKKDQRDMATNVEGLWNDLFKTEKFLLLCTYFAHNFNDPVIHDEVLDRICKHHTHQILPQQDSDTAEAGTENIVLDLFGSPSH